MEDTVTKQISNDPVVEGFSHHADNIASDREPYGPPGLKGLVANPFVLLCAACSTLGGLLFGYDQGVMGGVNSSPRYVQEVDIGTPDGKITDSLHEGGIVSIYYLGCIFGCFAGGWLADRIGRING